MLQNFRRVAAARVSLYPASFGKHFNLDVSFMKKNGYINTTKLCHQVGKAFPSRIEAKPSKDLFRYKVTIPITTRYNNLKATYAHEYIVIPIACWCSSLISLKIVKLMDTFKILPISEARDVITEPITQQGYVYVMTTEEYEKRDIYKIGYTEDLVRRLEQFNMSRLEEDQMYVRYSIPVQDARLVEKAIQSKLMSFRKRGEFFQCRLDTIKECLDEG